VSRNVYRRSVAVMGTVVTIQVVGRSADELPTADQQEAVERGIGWFFRIEECCSRFDAQSEAMRLTARIGVAVPVSDILYEAVRFALMVAEESDGAFDPTVGYVMETRGFDRDYRTGQTVRTAIEPGGPVSYRDVRVDPLAKTIALLHPLMLDLGAVAKGLAIDMAARELQPFEDFAIDAGGDLYLGGHNPAGEPWAVGIRHPRLDDTLIDTLRVSNVAVCTSGDYERRGSAPERAHHIIDPRTGRSASAVASATVVAPTAMAADALATAAFVLGPADGIQLLERQGVDGLIVSPTLERSATRGMYRDYSTVFSDAEGTSHHRPGDPDGAGSAGPGDLAARARPG
jgi:thiamine biosynthesis lipoprotein